MDEGLATSAIKWARISDGGAFEGKTFWGEHNSVSVEDITQGEIGNCWVMAAISALAENPDRVRDIFISTGYEPAGIYAMNMHMLGIPRTMIVDDLMPLTPDGSTLFGGLGKDGSYWAAIAEKMIAKHYGNYNHMEGGAPDDAVALLNGSPYKKILNESKDEVWEFITAGEDDNKIVTAGTG